MCLALPFAPETTGNVVSKSPDVNVIDRRLMGQIDDVLKVTQPWNINADVGVDLGERVSFKVLGHALPLAGALHITQRGRHHESRRVGKYHAAQKSKCLVKT